MGVSSMKHVMIDIETLGSSADAVILSIGLVHFNPSTNEIVSSAEFRCPRKLQEDMGRHVDPQVEAWWSRQSPEAQARLTEEPLYGNVNKMMSDVWKWLDNVCSNPWDLGIWAKGPSFDLVLCRDLAKQLDQKWKGHYSREYCVRTMLMIAKAKGWDDILGMEPELAHGAEADAIHQAKQVMAVMRRL
jgi:hypothetical protein